MEAGLSLTMPLLEVQDLAVDFTGADQVPVRVVEGLGFALEAGQTLALVGESGCGKSVSAASIMGLLPQPWGRVAKGSIVFDGMDLLKMDVRRLPGIRGGRIAMIFQEPMTALNPVRRVGLQIREVLDLHRRDLGKADRDREVLRLLAEVELPDPGRNAQAYPFQLSGGMRQRVMIAMALAGQPEILIADEPTTALDVTVQAQILRLLARLQKSHRMAMIYISHDLGVVARISDWICIMYAGQIVESGPAKEVLQEGLHPYTRGLRGSNPSFSSVPKSRLAAIPGTVPAPADYPGAACRFAPRCPLAEAACTRQAQRLEPVAASLRQVRCWKAGLHE